VIPSVVTSPVQVRRFDRADRDQLTDQLTDQLNAHIGAVVPNVSVSVSGLLSRLEREPGEFIVDPWVSERVTLVAKQRHRVVAAAHLLRYADGEPVGPAYRNLGEIGWLVRWPDAPYWPDAAAAGDALLRACLAQLTRWPVTRWAADGSLPAPGVYGVPEQWPHIHELYRRAGFTAGRSETVVAARVEALPRPVEPPVPGLTARRRLGINGTRFEACLGDRPIGYVEVAGRDDAPRTQGTGIWADLGNLHVDEDHRRRGVATWLLGQAADWLDLGGVRRLLGYLAEGDDAEGAFYRACGFQVLTRTVRDYARTPPAGPGRTATGIRVGTASDRR
jgi:GNAT superfamily N-acetyltransferase